MNRITKTVSIIAILVIACHISSCDFKNQDQVEEKSNHYDYETFESKSYNASKTLNNIIITKNLKIGGSLEASNAKIGTLAVGGSATLNNTEITGTASIGGKATLKNHVIVSDFLKVHGSLEADHATFSSLFVGGSATLNNAKITGTATINGNLKSHHSLFNGSITTTADETIFENSTAQSITIKKSSWNTNIFTSIWNIFTGSSKNNEQSIMLENSIATDITFECGQGKVYLKGNSSINKVTGGQIIKQ